MSTIPASTVEIARHGTTVVLTLETPSESPNLAAVLDRDVSWFYEKAAA
jgi:hypothetical protein